MTEICDDQLKELYMLLDFKPLPVPTEELALLHQTAKSDTGGSVGTRAFLFWLAGQPEPTGHASSGALELRRFDPMHSKAVMTVLGWWISGPSDDQPVYDILDDLARQFSAESAGIR